LEENEKAEGEEVEEEFGVFKIEGDGSVVIGIMLLVFGVEGVED